MTLVEESLSSRRGQGSYEYSAGSCNCSLPRSRCLCCRCTHYRCLLLHRSPGRWDRGSPGRWGRGSPRHPAGPEQPQGQTRPTWPPPKRPLPSAAPARARGPRRPTPWPRHRRRVLAQGAALDEYLVVRFGGLLVESYGGPPCSPSIADTVGTSHKGHCHKGHYNASSGPRGAAS